MYPLDDLDERLRRAATPDPGAVDRVVSAALSHKGRARGHTRLLAVAAVVLACVVGIGAWSLWSARTPSATATDGGDQAIWLRAPDGTTWIFAGPPADMLPPGSCVVIAAGGSE